MSILELEAPEALEYLDTVARGGLWPLREGCPIEHPAQCEAVDVEGLQCYREAISVVYSDGSSRTVCYCHRERHETDGLPALVFINRRTDTLRPPPTEHDSTKEWLDLWVRDDLAISAGE